MPMQASITPRMAIASAPVIVFCHLRTLRLREGMVANVAAIRRVRDARLHVRFSLHCNLILTYPYIGATGIGRVASTIVQTALSRC